MTDIIVTTPTQAYFIVRRRGTNGLLQMADGVYSCCLRIVFLSRFQCPESKTETKMSVTGKWRQWVVFNCLFYSPWFFRSCPCVNSPFISCYLKICTAPLLLGKLIFLTFLNISKGWLANASRKTVGSLKIYSDKHNDVGDYDDMDGLVSSVFDSEWR